MHSYEIFHILHQVVLYHYFRYAEIARSPSPHHKSLREYRLQIGESLELQLNLSFV